MYKLFVGNIPFSCTEKEFNNTFCNLDGFSRSELIHRSNSELTRGFGFVEFVNEECLNKILFDEFKIQNRLLRIAKYNNKMHSYKLFIKNIGNATKEELDNIFSKYGALHSSVILYDKITNESRGMAIIEYKNKDDYENVLATVIMINSNKAIITPYKNKPNKNNILKKQVDNQSVYRHGYNNGLIMGYNDGYIAGYNKGYTDKEKGLMRNAKRENYPIIYSDENTLNI